MMMTDDAKITHAITKIAKKFGVVLKCYLDGDNIVISEFGRKTGKPGAGAAAMRELFSVVDPLGRTLSLMALDLKPPCLIRYYMSLGFRIVAAKGADDKWLRRHQRALKKAIENDEGVEGIPMYRGIGGAAV